MRDGLTQEEFAGRVGVSRSYLALMERGKPPSFNAVMKLLGATGVDANWLLTGTTSAGRTIESGVWGAPGVGHNSGAAPEDDLARLSPRSKNLLRELLKGMVVDLAVWGENQGFMSLPFARTVRAGAGSGEPVFEESENVRILVGDTVLPGWARRESVICITAAGDSMEPSVYDRDFVAVDCSQTDPLDGQMFVVRTSEGLVVKRLRRRGSAWELASDNPVYSAGPLTPDDRIVGRAAPIGPSRLSEDAYARDLGGG